MSGKTTVFEILADEKSPAADHALLYALAHSNLTTSHMIAETLIVRRQRTGLLGLVSTFHELDESIRMHVLTNMDRVFSVLREAAQSKEEQIRLNVLEVIRLGSAYRAAYLTDAALHDRSSRVREAAAETLHALADRLLNTRPVPLDEIGDLNEEALAEHMASLEAYVEDRRQLVAAIEAGVTSFGVHLQPSVVEAAMWFADDLGSKLWSIMSVPGTRASRTVAALIAGAKSPRLVPFCMSALNYGELRPSVTRMLSNCRDPSFLAEWFRQAWRVAQPRAARGAGAIRQLKCAQDPEGALLSLPPAAARNLARGLVATHLPQDVKRNLLQELQRRGDDRCRRAATWASVNDDDDQTTSVLRGLAHGDDPATAEIARLEMGLRRPLEYPPDDLLAMKEGRGIHPAGRREAKPLDFNRLWAVFDQIAPAEAAEQGRRILAEDRKARSTLASRLSLGEPADRLRAIRLLDVLGMIEPFSNQLYTLSYDEHPEVRSAAVKALGSVSGAGAMRVLRTALNDTDQRVQANAIEAIDASEQETPADALIAKLNSPNSRVRANAVKALLKLGVREAAETLLLMLQSPGRASRISALWLVEHMGLIPLTERVMSIAESDEDSQVRDRARMLADQLIEKQAGDDATSLPSGREGVSS